MSEQLKEAKTVYACADHVYCPHCEAECGGWFGDPRDTVTTCDACKQQFKVAQDAEVRLV